VKKTQSAASAGRPEFVEPMEEGHYTTLKSCLRIADALGLRLEDVLTSVRCDETL
jgi:hypothetical protein